MIKPPFHMLEHYGDVDYWLVKVYHECKDEHARREVGCLLDIMQCLYEGCIPTVKEFEWYMRGVRRKHRGI